MRVLITGGSGFIGSHLVEHYRGRAEVVVLDNLRTGRRSNLEGMECEFYEGSILDREAVDRAMAGVDIVHHLAALVSVAESMERPQETVELNVTGLLNVLESARRNGARKLVFASSAAVYGENPAQPKVETLTPDPRSPYAVTKLDGEYYCALYEREGWLSTACLRFFNVFGPRQDPGSAYAAAVPIFLERARRGEPIQIHGDGGQTRDFIHVADIAGALAFVAEHPEARGVYNAGYGKAVTILELAERLREAVGSDSKLEFTPPRAGDIRHSTSDPSKLFALGWKPRHDVAGGLRSLVDQG
jgi:UDP-glucose 4-epimerase